MNMTYLNALNDYNKILIEIMTDDELNDKDKTEQVMELIAEIHYDAESEIDYWQNAYIPTLEDRYEICI